MFGFTRTAVTSSRLGNLHVRSLTSEQSYRLSAFESLKAIAASRPHFQVPQNAMACLPDGREIVLREGKLTPFEIAKDVSKSFANSVVVAEVNGRLWDINKPVLSALELEGIERPALKALQLNFYTADEPKGQYVVAHSAAHVLGLAMESIFPTIQLCDGPPIDKGANGEFFYEGRRADGQSIHEADLQKLTKAAQKIVKQSFPFERLEVSKAEALDMFQHNKYKQFFINKLDSDTVYSAYKLGNLVDLCTGPHLRHSGQIGAFNAHKLSGAYFLGNQDNEQLQRIYGVAFAGKEGTKKLDDWKRVRAESALRDHRLIGKAQHLFMLHPHSPGSPFFLPHGQRIINKLTELIKQLYHEYDYHEVGTPSLYKKQLWETSGHWDIYKDEMFIVKGGGSQSKSRPASAHGHTHHDENHDDHEEMGLKPMNCPGHCLIFANQIHSYRDLPIRMADFGALHRNEMAGALSGLTRVRKFHQDDAHVFCRPEQISSEVGKCIQMVKRIYRAFGFQYKFALSTRPVDFIGDITQWDLAEKALVGCLDQENCKYNIKDQDGAFYGPKIDVTVTDALNREHQAATIQLDFQLPQRFGLTFTDEAGKRTPPVMIHRAMLGSLERMFALLAEHTAGKWPMWVSPRQVLVVPVTNTQELNVYAQDITMKLKQNGLYSYCDTSNESLSKKILKHHALQFNYICVVGENEKKNDLVSVRVRGQHKSHTQPFKEFMNTVQIEAALPSTSMDIEPDF
eukprot:CFRG5896T1